MHSIAKSSAGAESGVFYDDLYATRNLDLVIQYCTVVHVTREGNHKIPDGANTVSTHTLRLVVGLFRVWFTFTVQ